MLAVVTVSDKGSDEWNGQAGGSKASKELRSLRLLILDIFSSAVQVIARGVEIPDVTPGTLQTRSKMEKIVIS